MPRYLIVVARDQPALCNYLTRNFSGDAKVRILLDRRRGERRQQIQPHERERRRTERRRRPDIGRDLSYRSVVIIRLEEE